MITRVIAMNFKGLEFTHQLKKHTLVIGPNGAGKSAISDTIALTVNGRIPGAGKTNQSIMDAFASNNKMFVGVEVGDEALFERRFIRNKKGKVTQKFQAGRNIVTKEKFISDFSVVGKPAVIDLAAFIDLSDQKKIDKVFELYPPKGDVMGLHDQIETATEALKELNATIKQTEGIIEKLTADQAEIELPAGTLAEVNQDIERTTAEVRLVRGNIQRQKIKDAEKVATEKAEATAAENARIEKENLAKAETEEDPGDPPPADRPTHGFEPDHTARNSEDFKDTPEYGSKEDAKKMVERTEGTVPLSPKPGTRINPDPVRENPARKSIWSIIKTMERAGCSSCAAMLEAKKQLRRY